MGKDGSSVGEELGICHLQESLRRFPAYFWGTSICILATLPVAYPSAPPIAIPEEL